MAPRKPRDINQDLQDQAEQEAAAIGGLVTNTLPAGTIQLPAGYVPPARQAITATRQGPTGVTPIVSTFTGRGLVDENGRVERTPQGAIREEYRDDEIRFEWFNLPFSVRQNYVNRFKDLGLISKRQKLDPNLVGDAEVAAFASVLANANIEGRTWRAVLPIMASRAKALGLGGDGQPKFRPTNIRDIEQATQEQARAVLGRELQMGEVQPFAARVQQQEMRQRQQQAQQPAGTRTLIEQGVQKQFGPEADAYRAAQFIDVILGGA